MNNEIICKKSCKQPTHATLNDPHISIDLCYSHEPILWVCGNGIQSTGIDLPLHMYDLMRELVNDYKVVEHYENLRNGLHSPS